MRATVYSNLVDEGFMKARPPQCPPHKPPQLDAGFMPTDRCYEASMPYEAHEQQRETVPSRYSEVQRKQQRKRSIGPPKPGLRSFPRVLNLVDTKDKLFQIYPRGSC
jgi:hypothetical protein